MLAQGERKSGMGVGRKGVEVVQGYRRPGTV